MSVVTTSSGTRCRLPGGRVDGVLGLLLRRAHGVGGVLATESAGDAGLPRRLELGSRRGRGQAEGGVLRLQDDLHGVGELRVVVELRRPRRRSSRRPARLAVNVPVAAVPASTAASVRICAACTQVSVAVIVAMKAHAASGFGELVGIAQELPSDQVIGSPSGVSKGRTVMSDVG